MNDTVSKEWETTLVANMHTLMASSMPGSRESMTRQLQQLYIAMRNYDSESAADAKAKAAGKGGFDKNGLPLNLTTPIPTAFANASDLAAYLIGVYAIRKPILQVPDLPNAMNITTAVKDALDRDSRDGGWAAELIKCIQNAVYLDYGPLEVRVTSTGTNKFKALCPFNTFVDTDVTLDKAPAQGRFAGYMEKTSLAVLYQTLMEVPKKEYLTSWGERLLTNPLRLTEIGTIAGSLGNCYHYHEPAFRINSERGDITPSGVTGGTDWSLFGNEDKAAKVEHNIDTMNHVLYTTTVYRRSRFDWLGLPKEIYGVDPKAQSDGSIGTKVPIYKMVYLNGAVLLSVEPVEEEHGLLPVVFGTMSLTASTGDRPYTITEQLVPAQAYSAKLMAARITAIRQSLNNKAIADRTLIKNPESLNKSSDDAVAFIETHKAEDGTGDIRKAYMQLPFDSSGVSNLLGMLSEGDILAERIIGNSAQMRGIRTPGNKLQSEVSRDSTFAEGRFQVYAIIFQQTAMSPIKAMLRSNLGSVPGALTYFNRDEAKMMAINAQEFRESQFDFGISDGLLPSQKRIAPDAIGNLLTAVTQIPELAQEFELRDLFILFAHAVGVEDIERVPKPQQRAQQGAPADGEGQGAQQQPPAQPPQEPPAQ